MLKRTTWSLCWLAAAVLLFVAGPPLPDLTRLDELPHLLVAAPEAAVVQLAAAAAWLVLAWLTLGWLAVLGTRLHGRAGRLCHSAAETLLPRVLRGVLEGGVGLSVVLSSAPALAATSGMTATAQVSAVPSADNQPLSLPSLDRRPTTELQLAPLSAVPAPVLATAGAGPVVRGQLPEDPAEVVVRRGDCLWSVVARALGPDADDAAVARAWPRWYAANRAVIGDDPALLLPGQRLVAPDQTS